jgi:Putative transposase of IS4/5 family (DUF4096)
MADYAAPGGMDSKDSLLGANQIQGFFWEAVLGVMERLVLSDAAWERMAPLIIGRPDQKGSTGRDNRMFVEGVLWIVRTGSPWRDLPEAFGGLEQRVPALQSMEHQGCLAADLRDDVR